MADSAFIPCPADVWTEIATGPLTDCLVTPTEAGYFLYAAAQPAATVTFGYLLDQFGRDNAVPEDGESYWFRPVDGAAVVIKTERAP